MSHLQQGIAGESAQALAGVPGVNVTRRASLAACTRFGIGGPAEILADASEGAGFVQALQIARASGLPVAVIGGGTNLIVADQGLPGIVLRYTAAGIRAAGNRVVVDAGAELQSLVDFTIGRGLKGLETLTRIPGWVGGAVYGNAGAYGHSISEGIDTVTCTDGAATWSLSRGECEFLYRESIFKHRRDWIILAAELILEEADGEGLRRQATSIERIRDEKFPSTMKCAGSIFKNLLLAQLPGQAATQVPASVIREGKVPAAWFLEQAGAKGMLRGRIHVAEHHANLLVNAGEGTARDLVALIAELKSRVHDRFGVALEEEVQYIGFQEKPL